MQMPGMKRDLGGCCLMAIAIAIAIAIAMLRTLARVKVLNLRVKV